MEHGPRGWTELADGRSTCGDFDRPFDAARQSSLCL